MAPHRTMRLHTAAVMAVLLLLLSLSVCAMLARADLSRSKTVNVVLMGATGNLAQKYLWQSLFNIQNSRNLKGGANIVVWPAGTKSREVSSSLLKDVLEGNVSYASSQAKARFLSENVRDYYQLSSPGDYDVLGKAILESQTKRRATEVGRLVYMSVPPKFFGSIAKEINRALRPAKSARGAKTWLKVIVEKPFGVDLDSAQSLAKDLFNSLEADEVLLVDHYMGKYGLAGMREFHARNPGYVTSLLRGNKGAVRDIEIQMVETEDVKGRTSFYDEVGVIRDTMQNHLMMMLSLFLMDTFKSGSGALGQNNEEAARLSVVRALLPGTLEDVLTVGQYRDYNKHIHEDVEKWQGKEAAEKVKRSITPTYARVALRFQKRNTFPEIPIIMTSGKALASRRAFLRLNLKSGASLVFNVQGELPLSGDSKGTAKEACVVASESLPPFFAPRKWSQPDRHHAFAPAGKNAPSAYEVLLRDALEGRFESFVKIPEVLESWRVWSPLLEALTKRGEEGLISYDYAGVGIANDELNNRELAENKKKTPKMKEDL